MVNNFLYSRLSNIVLPFILMLYYLGSYYWFYDDSSLVAVIRALTIFLAIIGAVCLIRIKNTFDLSFVFNNKLFVSVLLFFVYVSFNSYLVSNDLKLVRRSVLLFSFVSIIGFSFFSRLGWETFLRVLAVTSFCFALFSLVNLYMIDALPTGYRKGGISTSGIQGVADFGNTIIAAMHYAMGFTAALYLFFTENNKYRLIFWVLNLTVLSLYIILTFSRAGWVACFIPVMVMTLLLYDKNKKIRLIGLLLFLFSVFFFFALQYIGYEVAERGLTHRDEIWATVIARMSDSWVFGYGAAAAIEPIPVLSGAVYVNNTHNVYLEVYYKLGIVGLLFFLGILVSSLIALFKNRNHKKYGSIPVYWLSVLCSSMIVMIVELNELVYTPNMLWHWFWMPVGFAILVGRVKHEKKTE